MINQVIKRLAVPGDPVPTKVSRQFSNDLNTSNEVQAYAKIAGRDWTYYVKTLKVVIGRSTEHAHAASAGSIDARNANGAGAVPGGAPGGNGTGATAGTVPGTTTTANSNTANSNTANSNTGATARSPEPPAHDSVSIDLGPSKVVSRRHAVIQYNLEARRWELFVYGRNGLKVDGVRLNLPYGAPYVLGSGNILDIGGTQMMFILPDAAPSIADSFLEGLPGGFGPGKRPHSGIFNAAGGQQRYGYAVQNVYAGGSNGAGSGAGYYGQPAAGGMGGRYGPLGGYGSAAPGNVRAFQMYSKSGAALPGGDDGEGPPEEYAKPEAKDMKPPYSYATMITQAILSNPQGVLSLAEIYAWISGHFAYYRYKKPGWQNSIRHNLSLNKAFEKVPRKPNEPGKGMKWQISESYRRDFLKKWRAGTLNKGKRGTSVTRQLQLHMMRNHSLPDSGRKPVPNVPKHRRRKSRREPGSGSGARSGVSSRAGSVASAAARAGDTATTTPSKADGIAKPVLSTRWRPVQPQSILPTPNASAAATSGSLSNSPVRGLMPPVAGPVQFSPSNFSSPNKPLVLPDFRPEYAAGGGPMIARQDSSQERTTASPRHSPHHSSTRGSPRRGTPGRVISGRVGAGRVSPPRSPGPTPDSSQHPQLQRPQGNLQSSPAMWNYVQFSTPALAPSDSPRRRPDLESPLRGKKRE